MTNEYIPFLSKIKEIVKHTETEYTFRMTYVGEVRPGQFFEVSIPKYGEAPISVSGIGEDYVDLTIRKVGKVTGEIFELNEESSFFMRGPYGNGFKKENYQGKELIVVAGGTGVSPVRGVISYFGEHPDEVKKLHTILGFKSPSDILFREDLKIWEQQMELILKENLQYAFPDFVPYLGRCRYHDCAHLAEPGCAVLEALAAGELEPTRHASYARLYEAAKEIRLWEHKQP